MRKQFEVVVSTFSGQEHVYPRVIRVQVNKCGELLLHRKFSRVGKRYLRTEWIQYKMINPDGGQIPGFFQERGHFSSQPRPFLPTLQDPRPDE